MSNIMDYLDWRGDISFDTDPFNEVDNLILAQISYTDFEGVMTQDEVLSISEVSRIYFEIHSEEEVMERNTFYKLAPFVLKKASESVRFKSIRIGRYINMISQDREEQYAAVTFFFPDGNCYVAFRGTDNTIIGWKEDFNLTFMNATSGQKRAVEYLNYYFKDTQEKLILGGHSKGGNFAVYAGAFCDPEIRKRLIRIYSNDGPGFRDEILESEEYKAVMPKVVSIIPEESIVGVLLSNDYEDHIVKSTAHGINQHDPMTWMVQGKTFVETTSRSESSRLIDKTMMRWLATISDEDRKVFTDSLFGSLDSAGATTLNDLSSGGLKMISDFIKSIRDISPEKQQEFSAIVKRLLMLWGHGFLSDVKDMTRNLSISGKSGLGELQGNQEENDSLVEELMEKKNISKKEVKIIIRKKVLDKRKIIPKNKALEKSEIICDKIVDLEVYQSSDIILAYMDTNNEVSLEKLIRRAEEDGKRVYIPKVEDKTRMEFYLLDGDYSEGMYGIREPKNTSSARRFDIMLEYLTDEKRQTLMLMPGLAFDADRNRIGYGGGYYDRYLKGFEKYPVTTIGICYDFQILKAVPSERTDRKPDMIVTEKRVIQ